MLDIACFVVMLCRGPEKNITTMAPFQTLIKVQNCYIHAESWTEQVPKNNLLFFVAGGGN